MSEVFVVLDVPEGISVETVTLVPRERVRQWIAEKIELMRQSSEEAVEMVKLVSQERV